MSPRSRIASVAAGVLVLALGVSGCVEGEGSSLSPDAPDSAAGWSSDQLTVDFATYNPLSLIIKEEGWLEETLGDDVEVTWIQSSGSAAANDALRSGSLDVGSTAGSAALLARANGSPIKTIDVYSQPNWSAIVVAADSDIQSADDLRGKNIAANAGTDPYFFLLQTLAEAGIGLDEVTITQLQHADGKTALEAGTVDAWAGLDPLMSASVVNAGSRIVYDNPDFNSYGFLNATESFLETSPDLAQLVVDAYEKARQWAADSPDDAAAIFADVAGIDLPIANSVLLERTNLAIDPAPGQKQLDVLNVIGPIFVDSGAVAEQSQIDDALASLFETTYVDAADPSRVSE
ncbi:aliphatic sulfonate ABC transporter substrate-binding protein [Salinibacterium sp. NSLL150]|uniref:aliphatic sulfonate ABC transporter substrate-binding protein n=1 Tax=unclassified Salinibacterium TaxID=2632331 RepID=UPI0018CD87BE|nr:MULTISPECIES: aliphatic sulfonate ABC transporter substrate-binding protein [unclassified Salinibacterium]MBH0099065.1 aliphatic sulfonate ABC transporter substrate-binding protein [Salinibacterium sp. NSLL35]MBH0101819.1 aliphatic sulfonate ABC transporter substrate-binding protein [Salinibacterium sp. NSLL150]MBH0104579.1 aliphatic sulfonate ABC transporter substrate-binding protein [Salinibacterium sp. NSLL16]MBH0107339.1 aliphatic sulfonate ABC transporter substrate-binding protein [Sali